MFLHHIAMHHAWTRRRERRRRSFADLCIVLALSGPAAVSAVELPETPAWAVVEPPAVESSRTLTYSGTILRITAGTPIGSWYRIGRSKPVSEVLWQVTPGVSHEFNVTVHDHLRGLGYSVVDPTEMPFEAGRVGAARYRLAAIVSGNETNYHHQIRRNRPTDRSYGVTVLDMEVQLQDARSGQVVFRRSVRGYGIEQGSNPQPIIPALLNGLDHALADPELVSLLRDGDSAAPAAPPAGVIALRCQPSDDAEQQTLEMGSFVSIRVNGLFGSAVIVSSEGHALTAAHVVPEGATVIVQLPLGLELEAQVLRRDDRVDVALLQLPGSRHRCSPLSAQAPPVGAEIFAIGTGGDPGLTNSLTRGVVSGYRNMDGILLMQTDASVNPGTSGGALVDPAGRVQAIVVGKLLGATIEGIGFGVPAETVMAQLGLAVE